MTPLFLLALACVPDAPEPVDPTDLPECLPGGGGELNVPGSATELDAELMEQVETLHIAGAAIAVGRGTTETYASGFGLADPVTGLAATPDTPFILASVSKTVIGVLAMQLVEEGALDLEADVSDIVGFEVRNPNVPEMPITVRMLLTHTSTLWDTQQTWDATGWTAGDPDTTLAEYVEAYFTPGDPLYGSVDAWWDDTPGSFYCYSNMAVALAAVAVEHAGGADLETLAQRRIFRPLGMTRTSYRIDAYCDPDDLARGMAWDGAAFVPDDNGPYGQPEGHPEIASGMVRSTARDLLRFAMAIGSGGELESAHVLDTATVDALLTRQLDADLATCGDGRGAPGEQGIIWMHEPDANGDWVGHYGGIEGFTSSMWALREGELRYVVLVNESSGALYPLESVLYDGLDGL